MRNFFRELRNCEDAVLSEDAVFTNLAGVVEPYQEGTKKTLCEVISIVSSGRFFRINSPSYFIVKTFGWGRPGWRRYGTRSTQMIGRLRAPGDHKSIPCPGSSSGCLEMISFRSLSLRTWLELNGSGVFTLCCRSLSWNLRNCFSERLIGTVRGIWVTILLLQNAGRSCNFFVKCTVKASLRSISSLPVYLPQLIVSLI